MNKQWKWILVTVIFLGISTGQNTVSAHEIPESYEIKDFPVISQMPELPTGDGVTAAAMVLEYYGFSADKQELASEYLPCLTDADAHLEEDGKLYGNDINKFFIGNPFSKNSIDCGTTAIVTTINNYLGNGISQRAVTDDTGISFNELYSLVSRDVPVIVWGTENMEIRGNTQGWYTKDKQYISWAKNDRISVLTGYSADSVTIIDTVTGRKEYGRDQFETAFTSRGNQCVIVQ